MPIECDQCHERKAWSRWRICERCRKRVEKQLQAELGKGIGAWRLTGDPLYIRKVSDLAYKSDAEILAADSIGRQKLAMIRARVPYAGEPIDAELADCGVWPA